MATLTERERALEQAIATREVAYTRWREIVEKGQALRKTGHTEAMSQGLAALDEHSQQLRAELEQRERDIFAAKGEVEAVKRQLNTITIELGNKELLLADARPKELNRLMQEIAMLRGRIHALIGDGVPLEAA